ncbi:ABC transporter permease [Legionella sp. km772]|uniref:MlaE family ABC transporter permease n=1 Tax=Legionella sp. km772 TaxID=2498111 RepID=UPI000F8E3BB4|nr:ABC transporter permease [Legionella sp. km772]RUR10571.1 ABC transporter permease [Legionella sp. km772]
MEPKNAQICLDSEQNQFQCTGSWTVQMLGHLYKKFCSEHHPKGKQLTFNGEAIIGFDSAGALALVKCIRFLEQQQNQIELVHFSAEQKELIHLIQSKEKDLAYKIPEAATEGLVYQIGKETENKILQMDGLIILIGDLSLKFCEAIGHWRRFQLPSIVSNIYSAGLQALPIVALLSFLIGVVLAYQMGLQLETYGANIFIAYLSGMAIFREFAPLITAIIVAGRTSSAFTAQLGSMKINEEIDALLTMGLSPTELLVLPKVIGLLLIFPLLIFWADIFSIMGAMLMSKSMLGIGYEDFLQRLKSSVGLEQLMLGLYKAPAFAILIALVGCFQGFRVESTADSLGSQTTKSVVQALFLIIIADAAFSIAYSWMGL